MTFHNPGGTLGGIPRLWAWICVDPDGSEGIVGKVSIGIGYVPFVTGDERLARKRFGPQIEQMRKDLRPGQRFELRRYDAAT